MQVQEFSNCIDLDQIEIALRTVPESLEAAYANALSRIPRRNAEKARLILLLIAHSFEPLSLEEVADTVALPEPNDVLNICSSTFVSTDAAGVDDLPKRRAKNQRLKIVRLNHFSVKEYLISRSIQESTASYFYKSEQLAHLVLGEALVSFLIRTWEQKSNLTTAFCSYSIRHWFRHARKGQIRELRSSTTGDILSMPKTSEFYAERELLEDRTHNLFRVEFSEAYAAWLALSPPRSTPIPPLSCASLLGLNAHVEKLLDDGADIDAR